MGLTERNIVITIILSFVTCGIYAIYWVYKMLDELYTYTGQPSSAAVDIIIGLVTMWVWPAYKFAQLESAANAKAGFPVEDKTIIYIILSVVGLSIVVDLLVQSNINKLVAAGNR